MIEYSRNIDYKLLFCLTFCMKVTEVEWADSFAPLSSHFCPRQQEPGSSRF